MSEPKYDQGGCLFEHLAEVYECCHEVSPCPLAVLDDAKCPQCGAEEWLGDGDGLPYICAVCGFEETT